MRKTSVDRREKMNATLKTVGTLMRNARILQNAKLAQQKACRNSVTSCILRNCKYRDYLVSNRRLHMLCYSCRARSGTRETLSRTQRRVATKTLSFQTPSKSNSPTFRLPSTLTAKTCNASRRTERTTYAYTRQTQHCRRCSITSSRASLWTCPCAESHPR